MNQPLDAKFEDVTNTAKRRWIWILLGLFMGLLPGIAAIIFFIIARQNPDIPDYAKDLSDLRLQVARLEDKLNQVPQPPDIAPLETRLAQLEQRQESAPDLSEPMARLNTLEQALAAIHDQQKKLAAQFEASRQDRPVPEYLALGMALLHWRYALETGRPFRSVLEQIEGFNRNNEEKLIQLMDKAAPFAESGAPTMKELQAAFPAREIASAIEGKEVAVEDQDWLSRIGEELAKIIVIRRTQPKGDGSALDKLAMAEAYLTQEDLAAAIETMSPLPPPAPQWIEKAQHRLAADQIKAELDAFLAELVER